jgi:hypothetical protein
MIAGTTLVSLGAASLAGMSAALYQWNRDSDELELIEKNAIPGMISGDEQRRASELDQRTKTLKTLAITTGTIGVASTIAGAVLLIVGDRRHARTFSLQPMGGRGFAGAVLQGSF